MCVKSLIPKVGPITVGFPQAPIITILRPFDKFEVLGDYPNYEYHFIADCVIHAVYEGSVEGDVEGVDFTITAKVDTPPIIMPQMQVIVEEDWVSLAKSIAHTVGFNSTQTWNTGGFGTTYFEFNSTVDWTDIPGGLAAVINADDKAQINITHDMETHKDGIALLRDTVIKEIEDAYGMSELAPPILEIATSYGSDGEAIQDADDAVAWIERMIPKFSVTQTAICDLTFMNITDLYKIAVAKNLPNEAKVLKDKAVEMEKLYNVTVMPKSFDCTFNLMVPQPFCGVSSVDGSLGTLTFDLGDLPSANDLYALAIEPTET
jgi:hypothetical protein